METPFTHGAEVRLCWVARHRWASGSVLRRQMALSHSFWLVLDGVVTVETQAWAGRIPAGSACLLPPHPSRDITAPDGAEWLSLGFLPPQSGSRSAPLQSAPLPHCWCPAEAERRSLLVWMEQLEQECAGESAGRATAREQLGQANLLDRKLAMVPDSSFFLLAEALGRAIYAVCLRHLPAGQASSPPLRPLWLTRALAAMQRDPTLSIRALADSIPLSPAQLRREFHRWLGLSPQAALTGMRLEEACRLLRQTELTIETIADCIGFRSAAHFSRLFKRIYGLAPGNYRRSAAMPPV